MHKKCFLQKTDTVLCSYYILTRSASWQFGSHISAVDDILLFLRVLTSYVFMYTLVRRVKKGCFLKFIFRKVQVVFRNLLPYGSIIPSI